MRYLTQRLRVAESFAFRSKLLFFVMTEKTRLSTSFDKSNFLRTVEPLMPVLTSSISDS
jgi:hypothetical protein